VAAPNHLLHPDPIQSRCVSSQCLSRLAEFDVFRTPRDKSGTCHHPKELTCPFPFSSLGRCTTQVTNVRALDPSSTSPSTLARPRAITVPAFHALPLVDLREDLTGTRLWTVPMWFLSPAEPVAHGLRSYLPDGILTEAAYNYLARLVPSTLRLTRTQSCSLPSDQPSRRNGPLH
jgi:hypothetical protein